MTQKLRQFSPSKHMNCVTTPGLSIYYYSNLNFRLQQRPCEGEFVENGEMAEGKGGIQRRVSEGSKDSPLFSQEENPSATD